MIKGYAENTYDNWPPRASPQNMSFCASPIMLLIGRPASADGRIPLFRRRADAGKIAVAGAHSGLGSGMVTDPDGNSPSISSGIADATLPGTVHDQRGGGATAAYSASGCRDAWAISCASRVSTAAAMMSSWYTPFSFTRRRRSRIDPSGRLTVISHRPDATSKTQK